MTEQYILFNLGEENYSLPIKTIETIEKLLSFTRVPNAESYVRGVINLRGEVIPVMDLRDRLSLPKTEYNHETRIIVNKIDTMLVGIIVDSTKDVITLSNEDIEFKEGGEDNGSFLKGIGRQDGEMIIILDLNKIVDKAL